MSGSAKTGGVMSVRTHVCRVERGGIVDSTVEHREKGREEGGLRGSKSNRSVCKIRPRTQPYHMLGYSRRHSIRIGEAGAARSLPGGRAQQDQRRDSSSSCPEELLTLFEIDLIAAAAAATVLVLQWKFRCFLRKRYKEFGVCWEWNTNNYFLGSSRTVEPNMYKVPRTPPQARPPPRGAQYSLVCGMELSKKITAVVNVHLAGGLCSCYTTTL